MVAAKEQVPAQALAPTLELSDVVDPPLLPVSHTATTTGAAGPANVAFKSREDHRKQLELEEARKAELALAEVDEDGKEISPHIPQYMSSAPWYLNAERPLPPIPTDPVTSEVIQMRQALQRYSHILSAGDHYTSWQEVEAESKEDPEGLALRLDGKGVVSVALEVAESAGLSIDLRKELQGRQLVKLLTADPLCGGGPAEASWFLSSVRDPDDALPVAMVVALLQSFSLFSEMF